MYFKYCSTELSTSGLTFAPFYPASSSDDDAEDFTQELNYPSCYYCERIEKEKKEEDLESWLQEQVDIILCERAWAKAKAWWNDQKQAKVQQPRGFFKPIDFSKNSSGMEDPRAARPEARSAIAHLPIPFLSKKESDVWWK